VVKPASYGAISLSLGLHGSNFVYAPSAGWSTDMTANPDLHKERISRLGDGEAWNRDLKHIAFGMGGAWVLVGSKGDFVWDLKGLYPWLEKFLTNATCGIEVRIECSAIDSDYLCLIWSY